MIHSLLERAKQTKEIKEFAEAHKNSQHNLLEDLLLIDDGDFVFTEHEEEIKTAFYIYEYDRMKLGTLTKIIDILYRKAYNSYRNRGEYYGLVLLAGIDVEHAKLVCNEWRDKIVTLGTIYHNSHAKAIGYWRKMLAFREANPKSTEGADTEFNVGGGEELQGKSKSGYIAYVPVRFFTFTAAFKHFIRGEFDKLSKTSIEKSIAAIRLYQKHEDKKSSYYLSKVIGKRRATKLYGQDKDIIYQGVEKGVILFNSNILKGFTPKSTLTPTNCIRADFSKYITGLDINENKKTVLRKESKKLIYQQYQSYFAEKFQDDRYLEAVDYSILADYGVILNSTDLLLEQIELREEAEAEREERDAYYGASTEGTAKQGLITVDNEVWECEIYADKVEKTHMQEV